MVMTEYTFDANTSGLSLECVISIALELSNILSVLDKLCLIIIDRHLVAKTFYKHVKHSLPTPRGQ